VSTFTTINAIKQGQFEMRVNVATIVLVALSQPVIADGIEEACIASERANSDRQLCQCIQKAADLTLSDRDQRLAATFFENPHRSQEIRQSDSRRNEAFWERYKNFGETAEALCSDIS